ncbi:hypothetical protein ASF72_11215 [Arthrobacter sp. Leaf141]|uniref:hypothetical protein n=1 Tax=Arthrobacter sp. Leaf141 TaxID=1736273 RepID=UPI0006FA3698|nr:hypothetical protein [Arthrobacter sp. Leaf141]KQR02190.1 hypothetical protein ASF72_11215 [Arthrobacter sp. Leaf141]
MAGTRSPWHALRPILLAGAAAVTWLTLSATASSADVLSDASSLLGETTGSVSSVAKKLTEPAGTVVRHAPDPVQQTIPVAPKPVSVSPKPAPGSSDRGLLSPVAGGVSGLADNVASSLPIVEQVVSAGTVATVTTPVATAVDAITVAVTEVASAPVAGFPVLEPVVSPVAEVVAGVAPVLDPVVAPVTEIVTDVAPVTQVPAPAEVRIPAPAGAPVPVVTEPSNVAAPLTAGQESSGSDPAGAAELNTAAIAVPASTRAIVAVPVGGLLSATPAVSAVPAVEPASSDGHNPGFPAPEPVQLPAVSGSGAASSASSANSAGAPAWLASIELLLPTLGATVAADFLEHAVSPVSFDPGSSPD